MVGQANWPGSRELGVIGLGNCSQGRFESAFPFLGTNMAHDPQSSFFTHIDVTSHAAGSPYSDTPSSDVVSLLQQLVASQQRQTQLLEELVQQMNAAQRQRANELGQWRDANPRLARRCREAAEALSSVQTQFLENLTEEITERADDYLDGDFLLNEFVDRFGPRLAHLNGVLQVLAQLSSGAPTSNASS